MKYADMLTTDVNHLRAHYTNIRELAFNNSKMAQGCRPGSSTVRKLAHQMGYLMRQIEMCENAARKRCISLVAVAA